MLFRKFFIMFLICIAGALLNSAVPRLMTNILVPPLFLDTIFTIAITLLFGLKWGVLCGFLNSLYAVTILQNDWVVFLFIICTVAAAFVTFLFMRLFPEELNLVTASSVSSNKFYKSSRLNAMMFTMIALLLLSFALAVAISILGGIVSAIINLMSSPEVAEVIAVHSAPLTPSMFPEKMYSVFKEILVRIPINILDRLISVFAAFGIAKMVCRHVHFIKK
jgi:hypothetical protein